GAGWTRGAGGRVGGGQRRVERALQFVGVELTDGRHLRDTSNDFASISIAFTRPAESSSAKAHKAAETRSFLVIAAPAFSSCGLRGCAVRHALPTRSGRRRLRPRSKRPRHRCAADKRDELATPRCSPLNGLTH